MSNPLKTLILCLSTVLFVSASLGFHARAKKPVPVSIGGGSVAGIYFQAAKSLCDLLNQRPGGDYRCEGRTTLGSVFNVNAVKRDLITFGLVQSDLNWQAWNGAAKWNDTPVKTLRSVLALHDEAVHLLAFADSGIQTVGDLKGKAVNIGNLSSGQRGNALLALRLHGLDPFEDIDTFSFQQGNALEAFMSGRIDALFYTVGFPSKPIARMADEVGSRLISLDSEALRAHVEKTPYYVMATIPVGAYAAIPEPVITMGLKTTLVTNANTPENTVYDLVATLFNNLEAFKKTHPAFAPLTPPAMLEGLTAPLHPGAAKFYREKGWLK